MITEVTPWNLWHIAFAIKVAGSTHTQGESYHKITVPEGKDHGVHPRVDPSHLTTI